MASWRWRRPIILRWSLVHLNKLHGFSQACLHHWPPASPDALVYIRGTEQGSRLDKEFPYSKAWWTNVIRDPRVRMKIGGKIYEMTVVLVTDRAEVMGRDPTRKEIGPDGKEQVVEVAHYFRVFQRNVPEYGSLSTVASSNE